VNKSFDQKLIIYTDGGSRGNPGPAASGYVVGDKRYGEFLGVQTNNYAEYTAVILALKKAKLLLGSAKAKKTNLEVRMDSQLIVHQMNHKYKVEHPAIQPLFLQVWNAMTDFESVEFVHIPREQNKEADAMVNKVLDEHSD
jgi:ribonuclease HI